MAHVNDTDSQPLKGVVLCCTSLAQHVRTHLAEVAGQMGADHKLDLTNDVTHLIVGDVKTAKYRYVAKERPDVRVLSPDFIEAVREAWMSAEEVDVEALEQKFTLPIFFGLHLCLTGVEDLAKRKEMEDIIIANGGIYNGDLTRQVTHLVVARPVGAKYTYAKQWGIHLVSLKWFEDCLVRKLAVDENCYFPEMPLEQQGVGAFRTEPKRTSPGKRGREDEQTPLGNEAGRKKLRKTASMRINAQSQEFWQDLSTNEVQVDDTLADAWQDESQTMRNSASESVPPPANAHSSTTQRPVTPPQQGLFGGLAILLYGFEPHRTKKLQEFLEPNGARVVASEAELRASAEDEHQHAPVLVVPHDKAVALPVVPERTVLATEWWVERCLHYKKHIDPSQDHLSSPLSNAFLAGFQNLNISTTGFTGVDLRQAAQLVKLMGATYQEVLSPSSSLLVSATDTVKAEKAAYAAKHQIPIVSADWLWQSLVMRGKASVDKYSLKVLAADRSDMVGEKSASSSGRDQSHGFLRTGDERKIADESLPKRLSNTRKRHATPVLPLQAFSKLPSKPKDAVNCPFVLEDDEEEDTVDMPSEPPTVQSQGLPAASDVNQPLRAISPNISRSKDDSAAHSLRPNSKAAARGDLSGPLEVPENDLQGAAVRQPNPNGTLEEPEQRKSPSRRQELTSELAGLLYRNAAADTSSHPKEEKRRKHRPLGRNLSVISNRSSSASGSPALAPELAEHLSPADGFLPPEENVSLPPSTQLGYDPPDAVRTPSIGTVKDVREVAGGRPSRTASGTRAKAKGRTKS